MSVPQQPNDGQEPRYQQPQYQQQPRGYGIPGPGEPFNGAASPDDLTRPLYGATIGQAVTRFFKNYVNFKGRASRSEFWWLTLAMFVVAIVISIIEQFAPGLGIALNLAFFLGTLLPSISITWRRLHDANFAGPWFFLSFAFGIGAIVVVVFTIMGSKPEGRRFDAV